jgi:putative addiction module component (TIGR02574 family)
MEKYMQELSDKLLMLPSDDRAYLAHLLLQSLGPVEEISDQEYEEDMRRIREAEEHPERTITWEEIKARWNATPKAS